MPMPCTSRIAIVATSRDSWFHATPQTSGLLAARGAASEMKHKTIQTFEMDDDGTCTVSKGGQSVTRRALFTPR